MPMSQFSSSLRKVLMYLPTTYGTSLMKSSIMSGTLRELKKILPNSSINSLKESIDIRLIVNDKVINNHTMYLIVMITIILLFIIYILSSVQLYD